MLRVLILALCATSAAAAPPPAIKCDSEPAMACMPLWPAGGVPNEKGNPFKIPAEKRTPDDGQGCGAVRRMLVVVLLLLLLVLLVLVLLLLLLMRGVLPCRCRC